MRGLNEMIHGRHSELKDSINVFHKYSQSAYCVPAPATGTGGTTATRADVLVQDRKYQIKDKVELNI